nr:type I restriction enzyme HsdR N-terminal domain-containing protein [uncultured Mucilaginibacter sp.]
MHQLQALNLPPHPFKITEVNGQLTLFDEIRKKTIIITPEEWVRQHFVQFLIKEKKYPKTLIKLEGGHKLHGMQKRSDIIIFNKEGRKILMVECKAPGVTINQKVFEQIARYNMVHKIELLAVTNGLQHYFCVINFEDGSFRFIEQLPVYAGV